MAYETPEEDVLFDLKDYLETNIDTYLSGIETEKGDGLDLAAPKQYEVADADVLSANLFPAVYLFPEMIGFSPLSTQSDSMEMRLDIIVVIKGGKTENLPIKVLRYGAAFRQAIDVDRTAGGVVDSWRVEGVKYYQRDPGSPDRMVVEIVVVLTKEVTR